MPKRKPILPKGVPNRGQTRAPAAPPKAGRGKAMERHLSAALDRLTRLQAEAAQMERLLRSSGEKLTPSQLAQMKKNLAGLFERVDIERAHVECQRRRHIYEKIQADPDGFARHSLRLFSREEFAPLHFDQATVQEIIARLGPPPVAERVEQRAEYLQRAVLLAATPARRKEWMRRLLNYAPRFVDDGRFEDAWTVLLMAAPTLEDVDKVNPFLACMADGGLMTWEQALNTAARDVTDQLGLPLDQAPPPTSPEYQAWLQAQLAAPELRDRAARVMTERPDAVQAAARMLDSGLQGALHLLERGDLDGTLLAPDVLAPVLAELEARGAGLAERWRATADEAERAVVQAGIGEMLFTIMREALPGLWTPARRAALEAGLTNFITRAAKRDKPAVGYARIALLSLTAYENPTDNRFLIGWAMRAVQQLGKQRLAGADNQRISESANGKSV
ncbi:MAG: hypothetical protein CVU38_15265 [Chloroflexi bacterium HGW-Chloroflexi-1]|nr:MAG: hypothetical protein CVU38_15265 [Chloroflexi bacterium HGW-Chloroflexi-1]